MNNIPATLAKCRAELARQQEMERKATPGPYEWDDEVAEIRGEGVSIADVFASDEGTDDDGKLLCLSRNLNSARLRVAELLLDFNGQNNLIVDGVGEQTGRRLEIVRIAAALLGVDVVNG